MTIKSKVLFLHGLFAQNSSKPNFIRSLGFDVLSPELEDWNFNKSVAVAQENFNIFKPNIVVGSSRGAAVAMNIESEDVPLILLSPPWFLFGSKNKCKSNSIIIQSDKDIMVPLSMSVKLSENSNCRLIVAGESHRLNCASGRNALAKALNSLILKV